MKWDYGDYNPTCKKRSEFYKFSVYLDIIEREESDHGIVLSFVPIFVDLASDEDKVTSSKCQFPSWLSYKIVQSTSNQARFWRWILRSASVTAKVIDEIVVPIKRDRWLLRWAEIDKQTLIDIIVQFFCCAFQNLHSFMSIGKPIKFNQTNWVN